MGRQRLRRPRFVRPGDRSTFAIGTGTPSPLELTTKQIRHGPGRPPKYGRPSRAVSMTLPEDVLVRLRALDPDLGSAIVRLVERNRKPRERAARLAEIAAYGSRAVIVVNLAKTLKRLPGVQLVPIGNGRALIALEHPHSIAQF